METIDWDVVNGNTREVRRKVTPERQPENTNEFQGENIPENPFDFTEQNASVSWWFFLLVLTLVVTVFFAQYVPVVLALVIAMFCNFVAVRVRQIRAINKTKRFVASLKTPVFIVSKSREDKDVYLRKVEADQLIKSSWVESPYMPVPPVYALYWGDLGETNEEWMFRRDTFKEEKTKAFHADIKELNEGFYYWHILGQKDYPWEEKELR